MNVCLITLGCPKNTVEGESIAGLLKGHGYGLTTDISVADAAIVHTCSFIADARDESSQFIKALTRLRRKGSLQKLIVSGCMGQEMGKKIIAAFPGVDSVIGTGELERLPELLAGGPMVIETSPGGLLETSSPRLLSSLLPSTYLRIAEGCSHRCSFCLIPSLRGPYRSRTMESILKEAASLSGQGIEELNLISQDITFYGKDRYGTFSLPGLLKKMVKVKGLRWIRLLYAYPAYSGGAGSLLHDILEVMKAEQKICRYLDIPLQHVQKDILKSMNRSANGRDAIRMMKEFMPELSLRTTFIVGFPGEKDRHFKELCEFVAEGWFDNLGVFEYSPHPALKSASLPGKVPAAVTSERRKELMLIQKKVAAKKNKQHRGNDIEVLVESALQGVNVRGLKGQLWSGRASFQAPEIDGRIIFSGSARTTRAGSFVRVRLTGSQGYDLIGNKL